MDNLGDIEALEDQVRLTTAMPKQAGDGIVLIDLAGTVQFANLAWVVMHGYSIADELIGKHLSTFHTEEEMNSLVHDFMEEVKHRGQLAGPVEHLRSDGTVFSSQTKMTVTRDKEGEIIGLAVIASVRPRTESTLEAYINRLEQYLEQALGPAQSEDAAGQSSNEQEIAALKADAEQTLAEERARAEEASEQNAQIKADLEQALVHAQADAQARQASYEQETAARKAQAEEAVAQCQATSEETVAQVKADAEQALAEERTWAEEAIHRRDELEQALAQAQSEDAAKQAGYEQEIAAEEVDQLDQGFAAVLHDIKARQKQKETLSPVHPLYPLIVFILVMSVSLALLKFVIPAFKNVLDEMTGDNLPYITELFINVYSDWGELIFSLILAGIIFFLLTRLFRWLRPEACNKDGIMAWFYDWVKWHLPILHWFEQNHALSQLVGTLRFSCQAGCPVDQAIRNCLGLDINNCFRRRVKGWLKRVESGQDIAQAARASKLSSTLAWAFDPKVNSGNTLNVLTMLETFYRSNYSYRVNLARIVLTPTITIGLAVFVGFVVVAMYLPAVSVITALTPVYP